MKTFNLCCLLSIVFFANLSNASFSFTEKKLGHELIISSGSKDDLEPAKAFCVAFFKPSYEQIPSNEREFNTLEEFVKEKFHHYEEKIFTDKQYDFFTVKNDGQLVGYFIVDNIDETIYALETQVDIAKYDASDLMKNLLEFLMFQYSLSKVEFVAYTRKAIPMFGKLLENCGFSPCDKFHQFFHTKENFYNAFRIFI